MKFRKKPVVIEAVQWFTHGDHPAVSPVPYDHPVDGFAIKPGEWGWIRTLESAGHLVQPGDWIVTGVQGEHYAVKPDIFAATYEPVAEAAAVARGIFAIDQVWKSRDGRRLRVVCIDPKRIGVRNSATGRLSYWRPDVMQRLSTLETNRTASDA